MKLDTSISMQRDNKRGAFANLSRKITRANSFKLPSSEGSGGVIS